MGEMTKNERRAADNAFQHLALGNDGAAARTISSIIRSSMARDIRGDLKAYAASRGVELQIGSAA
jgi:hypothetical protein